MGYLNSIVLDNGLSALAATTHMRLCSAEPTTYAEAVSLSLGVRADPELSAISDAAPSGRKVSVAAFADGEVAATGTGTHWALVDASGSVLLAANTMNAPLAVTAGGVWGSNVFNIPLGGVA